MKSKNRVTIKCKHNSKDFKDYCINFLVGITSGVIVLFLGDTLSYIGKRDWISFLVRLILLLILLRILFNYGLKIIQKINCQKYYKEEVK